MIIAGAGGAAHLPGMIAVDDRPAGARRAGRVQGAERAWTSLLSIVQMPAGIPVGTLAIGEAGANNAGLLAAAILALSDEALAEPVDAFARAQTAPSPNRRGRDEHGHLPRSPPGSTIGILGGGQLGRMLALAAARLGFDATSSSPTRTPGRRRSPPRTTVAPYDDEAALAALADAVDVVTYEFENVPAATVELLPRWAPVRPARRALAVAQDRLSEKTFLNDLGAPTVAFAAADDADDAAGAVARLGAPGADEDPARRLRRQGPALGRARRPTRRGLRARSAARR